MFVKNTDDSKKNNLFVLIFYLKTKFKSTQKSKQQILYKKKHKKLKTTKHFEHYSW